MDRTQDLFRKYRGPWVFLLVLMSVLPAYLPLRAQTGNALQDAQSEIELNTDAERAAQQVVTRTKLRQKYQRGGLTRQVYERDDASCRQFIGALQQKYASYGGSWGTMFSQAVAADSAEPLEDDALLNRLEDVRTPLGVDAHEAAQLNLLRESVGIFLQQGAITRRTQEQTDAQLKHRVDALNAKYAGTPQEADYNDRVTRLLQPSLAQLRPIWETAAQQVKAQQHSGFWDSLGAVWDGMFGGERAAAGSDSQKGKENNPQTSPESVALLVLLLLAAASYYLFHRSGQKSDSASYTDLKPLAASLAAAFASSPAAQSPASPPVQQTSPVAGTLKERIFAQEKLAFQARYNQLSDEYTRASAYLAKMDKVVSGIQGNLKVLGKSVQRRVQGLAFSYHSSLGNLARSAVMCKPVMRIYSRAGKLLKLLIIGAGLWYAWTTYQFLHQGMYVNLVLLYAIPFVSFFVTERYLQLKEPLRIFKSNAEKLKQLSVGHAGYEAGDTNCRVTRVWANPKGSPIDEFSLSPKSWGTSLRPDFFFYLESMAVYSLDLGGSFGLLFSDAKSEIMAGYGSWMTQALNEQKAFAPATLGPLASYTKAASRKLTAAEALPSAKKLLEGFEHVENTWRDIWVSDEVFEFLIRRIGLFNLYDEATPGGILLYGYPGNGKAYLARKIAESVSARFEAINPATLNSAKEVIQLWDNARGKGPVVLFLDFAERVFPRPGSEESGGGTKDAALAFINEWGKAAAQQSHVWVIMSAQSDADLDPSILAFFGNSNKIEITSPDDAGRDMVLRAALSEIQVPGTLPSWLVSETGGSTIHDLREIVKQAKMLAVPNAPTDEQWHSAVKTVRTVFPRDPTKTWDHLILPEDVKDQLKSACKVLRNAEGYRAMDAKVPFILLCGPPGTGKTEAARTLANESGVQFIPAGTADLKAGYIGQSAHLVRGLFAKARAAAPSILFLDDVENVMPKRDPSAQADSFSKDIVSEMLTQLDGAINYRRPVFLLAATNFPQLIDDALLERFTAKIEIPLPDDAARGELFKGLLRGCKALDPALDVDKMSAWLAQKTPGKSGRALKMIIERAMEKAVRVSTSPKDLRLTEKNLKDEVSPQGQPIPDAKIQKIWSKIVLEPEIKESIIAKIQMFVTGDPAASDGLLLYGPSGTGKTEIGRLIADTIGGDFLAKKGSDVKAAYSGQAGQAVRRVFEDARSRDRCVLFFDDCDSIFGRRGSVDTDKLQEEIVDETLASWGGMENKGRVWVLGATNHLERLDEAIVRRFGAAVEIGLPNPAERVQIIGIELQKVGRDVPIPDFVGADTNGMAGGNLKSLVQEVCTRAAQKKSEITPEIWKESIHLFTQGSDPTSPDDNWDTLVLADDLIERFKFIAESLHNLDLIRQQGYEPSSGILLYGPPGTGKTQIARTMASQGGLSFFPAGPADLKQGYLGQSGQKVRELFVRARAKAPCILFIDELDKSAAGASSPFANQYTEEIVGQLETELDGVKRNKQTIFLLAATNHRELIEPAILSRFTEQIEIPYPDEQQRARILQILLAKKTIDFDMPSVTAQVAAEVGHVSGRDLVMLIKRAGERAMARAFKAHQADHIVLTRDDLFNAFQPAPAGGVPTPAGRGMDGASA